MERNFHAFEFLKATKFPDFHIAVAHGAENFLAKLVIDRLVRVVLGENCDDVPYSTFQGDQCEWRDVADQLSTASLFGGDHNLVVVENADRFVTAYRDRLEKYASDPPGQGTLVLSVNSWMRTTKIAKQVDKVGLAIACKPPEKQTSRSTKPDIKRLAQWLGERAEAVYDCHISEKAAIELIELAGLSIGLLDQHLAKLALFAGLGGKVTTQMVIDHVGGWKAKTTWDYLDATSDGNANEALTQLDRLLQSGDAPVALLAACAWSWRRFALATRAVEEMERSGRRANLKEALEQGGVRNYPAEMDKCMGQLKQIGRRRAGQLLQRLLEADLQLKSSHSSDDAARFVLERLTFELSSELA
ncbi:MAG: DNA polymerase III subunit delta [Planctomycetales bacterium]|nr:DNA polymerase III subunit delta [Planctomycetales bacterium]